MNIIFLSIIIKKTLFFLDAYFIVSIIILSKTLITNTSTFVNKDSKTLMSKMNWASNLNLGCPVKIYVKQ